MTRDARTGTTRRGALRTLAAIAGAPWCASCARPRAGAGEVVLYTSADTDLAEPIARAFERASGARVLLVGDTEATKTTGLVHRLLEERTRVRADVWWSSEALGTVRLAREGVLEPYRSDAGESAFPGGWPAALRGTDDGWYGFAQRARAIVYDTRRLPPADVPRTPSALARAAGTMRIALARPQFGTTRSHVAAIAALDGEDALEHWLTTLRAGGLRLVDGNATVVRLVAQGECALGLTDTDDVWAGQALGWPVAPAFEPADPQTTPDPGMPRARGALLMPNTAAIVRGAPNPALARSLLDHLLSPETESILAASRSRNIPVRPDVAARHPALAIADAWAPDWNAVEAGVPGAMRVCERVLDG